MDGKGATRDVYCTIRPKAEVRFMKAQASIDSVAFTSDLSANVRLANDELAFVLALNIEDVTLLKMNAPIVAGALQ